MPTYQLRTEPFCALHTVNTSHVLASCRLTYTLRPVTADTVVFVAEIMVYSRHPFAKRHWRRYAADLRLLGWSSRYRRFDDGDPTRTQLLSYDSIL
jgi:hypothetical protein